MCTLPPFDWKEETLAHSHKTYTNGTHNDALTPTPQHALPKPFPPCLLAEAMLLEEARGRVGSFGGGDNRELSYGS